MELVPDWLALEWLPLALDELSVSPICWSWIEHDAVPGGHDGAGVV